MRAPAASNAFRFSTGRPTWLLVRSGKEKGGDAMDRTFAALRAELGSRVSFHRIEWESREADGVIEEFSLSSPPASVIADSNGRVVRKMESVRPKDEMRRLLVRLSAPAHSAGKRNSTKDTNTAR